MTTTPINRACPNGEAANLLASSAVKIAAAVEDAQQAAALLAASSDPQVVELGRLLTNGIGGLAVSAWAMKTTGERLAEHR